MAEHIDSILARSEPAYGGPSWEHARDLLLSDEDERAIVEHLAGVLRSGQRFERPVVITNGVVCNGMHRIVAAALVGDVTLEVADEYSDDNEEQVEITFDTAEAVDDDTWERIMGRVRSFPFLGRWAETDGFGSCGNGFEGVWTCPHDQAEVLAATIVERLAEIAVPVTITLCQAWLGDEDEYGDAR